MSVSRQKTAHRFKAKVSDWGMLRELDTRGFASQQKYPSISHLAPEVLLKGTMSKVRLHLSPARLRHCAPLCSPTYSLLSIQPLAGSCS